MSYEGSLNIGELSLASSIIRVKSFCVWNTLHGVLLKYDEQM